MKADWRPLGVLFLQPQPATDFLERTRQFAVMLPADRRRKSTLAVGTAERVCARLVDLADVGYMVSGVFQFLLDVSYPTAIE
jgi:hypothetical protein